MRAARIRSSLLVVLSRVRKESAAAALPTAPPWDRWRRGMAQEGDQQLLYTAKVGRGRGRGGGRRVLRAAARLCSGRFFFVLYCGLFLLFYNALFTTPGGVFAGSLHKDAGCWLC